MSQETGIFSVRRPRETLGALNINVSAIPMPSSAMKRSKSVASSQPQLQPQQPPFTAQHGRSLSGSRASLMPGRPSQPVFQRSSSSGNMEAAFSTAQRNSTSLNVLSTGRKSFAPMSFTPSTAAQQSPRRNSVYGARTSASRKSFFISAPVPAGVPRDPRPLRDRAYQNQIGQELLDFLTQNNFEMDMKHTLTQKSMISPMQKDFNFMFQWLYNQIDPDYKFQKGIEAEVPPILKQLRYPYEKSITKSQLSAVGGQNWPTFLGMLHWMMQIAQQMNQYSVGAYDDACMEANCDVVNDKTLWDYLSTAYNTWICADDQDDDMDSLLKPLVDQMAAKFDEANAKYIEDAKMLEAEHRALSDQIDTLGKTAAKVSKLEEIIRTLEGDKGKFEEYNAGLEAKCTRSDDRALRLDQEITRVEMELSEAEQERSTMQDAVDKQGLTIQEIDRMNSERERLQKGTEDSTARLEELRGKVSAQEQVASQKLEVLEKKVRGYNSLGYQIGIIPDTTALANGQSYELDLKVNKGPDFSSSRQKARSMPEPDRLLADPSSGYQPQNLLNLDLKGHVKNSIMALRKTVSERRTAAAEDDMEKKDLLDKTREAMEDKQQEVEGLSHRLRRAEEECEKTREITYAQKLAGDAQIEKLEKELSRARTSMTESKQLMEQRELSTTIAYEQLTQRAAALREELHGEVERMLNDVIRFKVHIQKSLEDYEQFVADEVEREYEEQEEGLMEHEAAEA